MSRSSGSGVAALEVGHEAVVVVHDGSIRRPRPFRQPRHRLTPFGQRLRGRHQRRFECRRRVDLHRPHRDVGKAELRLDHLPLFGHAETAVDRSWGLRADGEMCRAAATADAAAAAVEQRQGDTVVRADGDDLFLRGVKRPGRCEPAGVFRRIRIADHHFLPAADARAVPRVREQLVEDAARPPEVGCRFEEGHHPLRVSCASELLQQLDRQDVRGVAGHRDDVGAERAGRQRGRDAEGVEDVAHGVGRRGPWRQIGERPAALRERPCQPRDPAGLVRRLVRAQVPRLCEPLDGVSVFR